MRCSCENVIRVGFEGRHVTNLSTFAGLRVVCAGGLRRWTPVGGVRVAVIWGCVSGVESGN